MYHPLFQPNQQPSQPNPTNHPPPPAGRHVRGLCFYCCLLRRFTLFSAKHRITTPALFTRGGKAIFLLIFVHKLFVASSSPSPSHRPLFHPSSCISKRFSCLLLLPCCDLMCLYTQFSPRTVFPHCVFLSRCQFPSPGVANLNAFVITHLKKNYLYREKLIFYPFIFWFLLYKRFLKGKIFI